MARFQKYSTLFHQKQNGQNFLKMLVKRSDIFFSNFQNVLRHQLFHKMF